MAAHNSGPPAATRVASRNPPAVRPLHCGGKTPATPPPSHGAGGSSSLSAVVFLRVHHLYTGAELSIAPSPVTMPCHPYAPSASAPPCGPRTGRRWRVPALVSPTPPADGRPRTSHPAPSGFPPRAQSPLSYCRRPSKERPACTPPPPQSPARQSGPPAYRRRQRRRRPANGRPGRTSSTAPRASTVAKPPAGCPLPGCGRRRRASRAKPMEAPIKPTPTKAKVSMCMSVVD